MIDYIDFILEYTFEIGLVFLKTVLFLMIFINLYSYKCEH